METKNTKLEKVVVMGMGYVGFPLACAIAKSGKYEVYGFDTNAKKVDSINKKISPIDDKKAEEDLKEIELHATTDSSVIKNSSYIIICVPTPIDGRKKPDLTPVVKAAEIISMHLEHGQTIILESTVNPGVCEEVVLPILEKSGLKAIQDFELAHCPERINPGDKKWNVYNIPRNVGALTQEGNKKVADFYRSFLNASVNEVSSIKVAESTKILENTFRDVNIALVNQITPLFDKMGIDIVEVINGASNKPFAFIPHYPGCGVGGHCIAVDPYYLIYKAASLGFDQKLLKAARKINDSMPDYTINKMVSGLQKIGISSLKGVKIGLLGLSYKANTADMRESPALEIQKHLKKLGAEVLSYDPYCLLDSNSTMDAILQECVGVVIAASHSLFSDIHEWGEVKVIVDGRNCLAKEQVPPNVYYAAIGRGVDGFGRYSKEKVNLNYPAIEISNKISQPMPSSLFTAEISGSALRQ